MNPARWDVEAGRLQASGRITEEHKAEEYSDNEVRRATVYTREDLILVVSYLSALTRQVVVLKGLLQVLTAMAMLATLKYLSVSFLS